MVFWQHAAITRTYSSGGLKVLDGCVIGGHRRSSSRRNGGADSQVCGHVGQRWLALRAAAQTSSTWIPSMHPVSLLSRMSFGLLSGRRRTSRSSGLPEHSVLCTGGGIRALRPYGLLWLALLGVSAAIVAPPNIPVARHAPLLAVGMATLAGAVGLALLQLGVPRFWALGAPRDLCVGLAFGTLAVVNLVVRVVMPVLGAEPRSEAVTMILLIAGVVAAALFLLGLRLDTNVDGLGRRRLAWRVVVPSLGTLLASVVIVVLIGRADSLPTVIDAGARHLLDDQAAIVDILPGQAPWLVTVNGLLGIAMLVAAAGFIRRATASADLYEHVVAVALSLLAVGQLHALLFPPVEVDYVSVTAVFRLLAYLTLLFGLVARVGRDIAEKATQEERLRLSRELHDGLAQHLGLLTLRLSRAREPGRSIERRTHDLDAATHLVEIATLEARQAIVALRSGTMTWDELCNAVGTFADDFGRNHELAVDVRTTGSPPAHPLEAALRIEILRIMQEACSNAVRHGRAAHVEIELAAHGGSLDLSIRDDGRGFDLAGTVTPAGVGLRSMRERVERRGGTFVIESAPGQGAAVRIWVPLVAPREVRR
jgi:signal transduction histidine kinase